LGGGSLALSDLFAMASSKAVEDDPAIEGPGPMRNGAPGRDDMNNPL
jgi:hypothetical protein